MVTRSKFTASTLALAVAAVGAWSIAQQSPPTSTPYFDAGTPAPTQPSQSPAVPQPQLQPAPPVPVGPPDAVPPGQPGDPQQQQPQPPPPVAPAFGPQEIDGLLAPVALYPDALLSQVLMASTYPLEVVQARRFVDANQALQGQQLADTLAAQPWDASVKSLVTTPGVLRMMDDKLDWTVRLGNAFLAQQPDVMDAVQRLRAQAQQAGYLNDDQQRRVTVAPPPVVVQNEPAPPPTIIIEDASPEYVYVPVYDPGVVYGGWQYPAYRPFFWRPYGYVSTSVFFYDRPCRTGPAWSYAWGRPDWRDRRIDIDVRRASTLNPRIDRDDGYRRIRERDHEIAENGRGTWQHDTRHRLGVAYRDQDTARRVTQRPDNDRGRTRADVGVTGRPDQRNREAERILPDGAMSDRNDRPTPARTAPRPQVQTDTSPTPAERARADRAAREQTPARPDATPRQAEPKQPDPRQSEPRQPQPQKADPARPRERTESPTRTDATPRPPAAASARPTPTARPDARPEATPQPGRQPDPTPAPRREATPEAAPQQAPRREATPTPDAKPEPRPAPRREAAPTPTPTPAPRREAPTPAPSAPRPAPQQPAPQPPRGSAPERPAERPAPAPERAAPERPAPTPDRSAGSNGRTRER